MTTTIWNRLRLLRIGIVLCLGGIDRAMGHCQSRGETRRLWIKTRHGYKGGNGYEARLQDGESVLEERLRRGQ